HLSSADEKVPIVTATVTPAPAAPPAAVATEVSAEVDPDNPDVVAPRGAQAELEDVSASLTRCRAAQVNATGADLARLQDLEQELSARKARASQRVDELTAKVAELQAEAQKRAEKE